MERGAESEPGREIRMNPIHFCMLLVGVLMILYAVFNIIHAWLLERDIRKIDEEQRRDDERRKRIPDVTVNPNLTRMAVAFRQDEDQRWKKGQQEHQNL